MASSSSTRPKPKTRNEQLIDLLSHAWSCKKPTCTDYCRRMKEITAHVHHCPDPSNCKTCQQLFDLGSNHALNCRKFLCKVPLCVPIRDKFEEERADRREVPWSMEA